MIVNIYENISYVITGLPKTNSTFLVYHWPLHSHKGEFCQGVSKNHVDSFFGPFYKIRLMDIWLSQLQLRKQLKKYPDFIFGSSVFFKIYISIYRKIIFFDHMKVFSQMKSTLTPFHVHMVYV